MEPSGIGLQGLGENGAFIHNLAGHPLLQSSWEVRAPVLALARTLSPRSDVQVPFTKELAPILDWIAAPEVVRGPENDSNSRPNVTIRVLEE